MGTNDIPATFKLVKFIMVCVTVAVTGLTVWVLKATFDSADEERNSIYVVDSRNTLKLALAENVSVNRVAEAEAHVKRLHELLFILSPDIEFIKKNVSVAEYLAGSDVKNYCNSLSERGFYNSLVANGVSTEFLCDSIDVRKSDRYEFKVTLYGKTSMVSSDKIVFKSLVTECYLESCVRDELDPQGFVAQGWSIVREEEIGVVERKGYAPEIAQEQESDTTMSNE